MNSDSQSLQISAKLDWLDLPIVRMGKAFMRSSPPRQDTDPEDIAAQAGVQAASLSMYLRDQQLSSLMGEYAGTKSCRALVEIINAQENTSNKLSAIGYQNLRRLRAKGLLMVEIAADLEINVNDLMAFMRLHPDAHEDALQDEETCADARTIMLDQWIENYAVMSKFDSEKLKLRTQIQLEMNKRLSAKWALRTDKDLLMSQQQSHLTVVMGQVDSVDAPIKTLGGKPYVPTDHGPAAKLEDDVFEMVINDEDDDRNSVGVA